MKKVFKFLLWAVGVVAVLAVAAHFTLGWALNRPETREAVEKWLERSTGCRVGFAKIGYGVFPVRLSVDGLEVAKEGLEASVEGISVVVALRKGEITEVRVEGPSVVVTESDGKAEQADAGAPEKEPGGGGKGGRNAREAVEEVSAGWEKAAEGTWIPLRRVAVSGGRFELRGAGGERRLLLAGIEAEAKDVGRGNPIDATVSFELGGAGNPGKLEVHAGAFGEWAGRFGEWPVQARAEVLVEDLAAARAALGVADALPLQRPGLWLNCVGTPSNGVTVSGAFTDGQRYQSPDIAVNWKGVVRLAEAGPEGELEIDVPAFKWGAVAAKGGKVQASGGARADGGWRMAATGDVSRVEGTPGFAENILESFRLPQVTAWLPGLAERVEGAGIDGVAFSAEWESGSPAKLEARMGEGAYRLRADGTADPGEKALDLRVELAATAEETSRLAGGRSLEGWMPAKDGCLAFPVSVSGPWASPRIAPDLGAWGSHLKEQLAQPETQERVEKEVQRGLDKLKLHSKDRQNVEAGLKLLEGFLK